MNEKPTMPAREGHGTLKLASYQKQERRAETDRRSEPRHDGHQAIKHERRIGVQRVLRGLFGT